MSFLNFGRSEGPARPSGETEEVVRPIVPNKNPEDRSQEKPLTASELPIEGGPETVRPTILSSEEKGEKGPLDKIEEARDRAIKKMEEFASKMIEASEKFAAISESQIAAVIEENLETGRASFEITSKVLSDELCEKILTGDPVERGNALAIVSQVLQVTPGFIQFSNRVASVLHQHGIENPSTKARIDLSEDNSEEGEGTSLRQILSADVSWEKE